MLLQNHTLRRVSAVDEAAFIEFAHDAGVDDFFGFDLADFRGADFQHALHIAQAIERGKPFSVDAFEQILITFFGACGSAKAKASISALR